MVSVGTGRSDERSPREWCESARARLREGRPDAALAAARTAAEADPGSEWAHRLISLAQERLGHDDDAVPPAEHAVRLAAGSWSARLRLATALRRVAGRWDDATDQAALARAYAPEEAGPHVLRGDLALLRAEHAAAGDAYLTALARDPTQPQARVNLGLALLLWDRPRPAGPHDGGRARRALEVWTRQSRLLVALATVAVALAALCLDRGAEARLGGIAVLVLLVPITVRQARRTGSWPSVRAVLGGDPWLGAAVVSAVVSVIAFAAWLLLPAIPAWPVALDPVWAGLAGIAVLGWPVSAAVRALTETWRGRPLRALEQFALAGDERTARRNAGVTLWIVLGRAWSVLVPLAGVALAVEPRVAVLAVAVPYPLVVSWRRAWRGEDRWLPAATVLLVLAAAGCAAGGLLGRPWAWRAGLGAAGAVAAVFAVRAARSWWRGVPGPWRASLIMCDLPVGDAPSVALDPEVRQAFMYARSVVLAYRDGLGPRTVGAAASVSPSGELRLVAETEPLEADPRVAVFAADPLQSRFWVEVQGIAVADTDVLRITPKRVRTGRFPGRHQRQ
jgi:hypothetical protein